VVVANKQDLQEAWEIEDMRHALRPAPKVKLISCVATDRDSVKEILLELLYSILNEMENGGK
jgi:signal recognition particle receptor subunit beta